MTDVTPLDVRRDLIFRREIALFDLREENVFASGHPLFAANLPLSRLELESSTARRARTCASFFTTTMTA